MLEKSESCQSQYPLPQRQKRTGIPVTAAIWLLLDQALQLRRYTRQSLRDDTTVFGALDKVLYVTLHQMIKRLYSTSSSL
jgi:hypothetical protein